MKTCIRKITLLFAFIFNTFLSFGTVVEPVNSKHVDAGNQIEWSVEEVADVDFFIVQRSKDGVHFFPLSIVQTSKDLKKYQFIDEKAGGSKYYRIIKVDKDGVGEVSLSVAL